MQQKYAGDGLMNQIVIDDNGQIQYGDFYKKIEAMAAGRDVRPDPEIVEKVKTIISKK